MYLPPKVRVNVCVFVEVRSKLNSTSAALSQRSRCAHVCRCIRKEDLRDDDNICESVRISMWLKPSHPSNSDCLPFSSTSVSVLECRSRGRTPKHLFSGTTPAHIVIILTSYILCRRCYSSRPLSKVQPEVG